MRTTPGTNAVLHFIYMILISRLNLVKNTKFFCPKNSFFDKNGKLTHWTAQDSANVKELFFQEVILHQFLKRKNRALLSKNVQAILTLLNLAQKVPFLEDLKKKVSKSDWNQRHIVYVTQILVAHIYSVMVPRLFE